MHNLQHYDENIGNENHDVNENILDTEMQGLQDPLVQGLRNANAEDMLPELYDQVRRNIGLLRSKIDKVVETNVGLAQELRNKMTKMLFLLQGLSMSTSTNIGKVPSIPYVDHRNSLIWKSSFVSPNGKCQTLRKKVKVTNPLKIQAWERIKASKKN